MLDYILGNGGQKPEDDNLLPARYITTKAKKESITKEGIDRMVNAYREHIHHFYEKCKGEKEVRSAQRRFWEVAADVLNLSKESIDRFLEVEGGIKQGELMLLDTIRYRIEKENPSIVEPIILLDNEIMTDHYDQGDQYSQNKMRHSGKILRIIKSFQKLLK